MHFPLELNLLHFLPDFGALYAFRRAPNFSETHPWSFKHLFSQSILKDDMLPSCNYL
jgi:hypothetical protein